MMAGSSTTTVRPDKAHEPVQGAGNSLPTSVAVTVQSASPASSSALVGQFQVKPTVVCMVCSIVVHRGDFDGPLSHGIGPCCWDAWRAANGLKPREYPEYPMAVVVVA